MPHHRRNSRPDGTGPIRARPHRGARRRPRDPRCSQPEPQPSRTPPTPSRPPRHPSREPSPASRTRVRPEARYPEAGSPETAPSSNPDSPPIAGQASALEAHVALDTMTMVVKRLIVARHAESEYNVLGLLNGDPSVPCPLTARGRDQARALGRALAEQTIDLRITTDFPRTRETADIALASRNIPS